MGRLREPRRGRGRRLPQTPCCVLSTGDELKTIGTPLGPGEIYDSNRYTIYGLLERVGCQPIDLGNFIDDPEAIRSAFAAVASTQADVIITSGGVSVGEADFIKQMLNEMGEVLFLENRHEAGRPMAVGKVVMPTSSAFRAIRLLSPSPSTSSRPLSPRCRAQLTTLPPTAKATLTNKVKIAGRTEFQRGVLTMGSSGLKSAPLAIRVQESFPPWCRPTAFGAQHRDRQRGAGEAWWMQMFEGVM